MISEARYRALHIIEENSIHNPADFVEQRWPDSPYLKKSYKCGPYGSARGIAMNRTAGALLGKLRKAGLIHYHPVYKVYELTPAGKDAIAEYVASIRAILKPEVA